VLAALVAGVAFYDATPLLLAGPWLLAVLWAVARSVSTLRDSVPPSTADEARRRLAVR
jgi:hypothetical protein